MRDNWVPKNEKEYADHLAKQREARRGLKAGIKQTRGPRRNLTPKQRKVILNKTGGRCHICGGKINSPWQADHILSHSKGGDHSIDNYLPAHRTCNSYRWDYTPVEFQEIMRLGIWMRTQIIRRSGVGIAVAEKFIKYEAARRKRRKPNYWNA